MQLDEGGLASGGESTITKSEGRTVRVTPETFVGRARDGAQGEKERQNQEMSFHKRS